MSSPPRPGKTATQEKGAPAAGGGSMESWVVSTTAAPPEVTRMFRLLSKPRGALERGKLQPILDDAVKYFISGDLDETMWTAEKIKSHRGLKLSEAQDVFVGCYKTLRAGVRARMTDGQLEEDLQDLKCPEPIIEDFQAAVRQVLEVQATGVKCGNRVAITSTAKAKRLVHLKWRVDVVMTTNSMLRVRKPSIMMEFHFDDGTITLTECSPEKFQDLRYNVARMIKEIRQIERSRWVEDPLTQ